MLTEISLRSISWAWQYQKWQRRLKISPQLEPRRTTIGINQSVAIEIETNRRQTIRNGATHNLSETRICFMIPDDKKTSAPFWGGSQKCNRSAWPVPEGPERPRVLSSNGERVAPLRSLMGYLSSKIHASPLYTTLLPIRGCAFGTIEIPRNSCILLPGWTVDVILFNEKINISWYPGSIGLLLR